MFFKKNKAFQKNIQRFIKFSNNTKISYANYEESINKIYNYLINVNNTVSRILYTILMFRVAWIAGDEIDIEFNDKTLNEKYKKYLEEIEFISLIQKILMNFEIQNHVLLKFVNENKNVVCEVLNLLEYNYYLKNNKIYLDKSEIDYDQYFYYSFNEIVNSFTLSKVARCLPLAEKILEVEEQIEKLQKLFSSPVPVFKFSEDISRNEFIKFAKENAFRIGDSLTLLKDEDFKFENVKIENIETLFKRKIMYYQEISSISGIPIHFLGFPELIGAGRATAREYIELIKVAIIRERTIFINFLKKFIKFYLLFRNKFLNESNDINIEILISIPETTKSLQEQTISLLNEMKNNNLISLRTYLELNPFIKNTEEEMRRIFDEKMNEILNNKHLNEIL